MSDSNHTPGNTIISPRLRASYCNLFTPRIPGKNPSPEAKPRYSMTGLILPPENMMDDADRARWAQIQQDIVAVGSTAMGEDKFRAALKGGKIKMPIHQDVEYQGFPPEFSCYLRTWSYTAPGVVSIYRDPNTGKAMKIVDPDKVYSGCWVRVSLRPWCRYHETGGWSIGLQLQNVQWVKDDDRLDGKSSADSEFGVEGDAPNVGGTNTSSKDELADLLG